jgi:16S rRNA U1498 N3-methylase RsmE
MRAVAEGRLLRQLAGAEEDAAIASDFAAVSLGARVLRAETAALTALALLV